MKNEQINKNAVFETTLERQLEWIAAADCRASFIFAIDAAMLGFTATTFLPTPDGLPAWALIAPAVSALMLAVSLWKLTNVWKPRLAGPRSSLLFFGDIASRSPSQFISDIRSMTAETYLSDLATQCHRNAEIASEKFLYVRESICWMQVAIIPWLLSFAVLTLPPILK